MLPQPQTLPTVSKIQRQKSVSRRVISKFKEGIASRSKSSMSIRPADSENSLAQRLSGRRKQSNDIERRAQSFELSRDSIDSVKDVTSGSLDTPVRIDQRSFTDSTMSTSEVPEDLGDSPLIKTTQFEASYLGTTTPSVSSRHQRSSPTPLISDQPTPRPLRKSLPPVSSEPEPEDAFVVPCVDLEVALDCTTIDVHSKRDVWVAMKAKVRAKETRLGPHTERGYAEAGDSRGPTEPSASVSRVNATHSCNKPPLGSITSLRLCYKPVEGCRIREVIGQKYTKDLILGQECELYVKIRVPRIHIRDGTADSDQGSLFAELESIVGTLETDIMHVEARYRHSLLPTHNVVTVRHACKVKRPKTESRWSLIGSAEAVGSPNDVHAQLGHYIVAQYPAALAKELLEQYLGSDLNESAGVLAIRKSLDQLSGAQETIQDDVNPSVVVTDIDLDVASPGKLLSDQYSTAPSTPIDIDDSNRQVQQPPNNDENRQPSSTSLLPLTTSAPPLISAPKTTTALTTAASSSLLTSPESDDLQNSESQDSARKLWRHIRRTSLSAKQLEEMTPERLQHLEAGDETLKERRRKALANKRSIGAETLKGWKWEESMQGQQIQGEAPWM